jgi:3-phenylpropionate/trans-cinnamate dioxygenase ferredoxin component
MQRIKMGKASELSPGKSIEKRILARRIAVFNVDGELFGIESDCKHMKASLQRGTVRDKIVTCPWHHWQYDIRTGQCLTVDKFKLKTYQVEIEGDDVYIVIN